MKKCSFPDCEEEESLPFKCKLCGQYFCAKHRLPEQHLCPKLGVYQSEEYKKAKISPTFKQFKEKEEKESNIKQFGFYDDEPKLRKSRQLSLSKTRKSHYVYRSPMLTLFSFGHNIINILLGSFYILAIFSLNLIIDFSIFSNIELSLWGSIFGYIFLGYFLGILLVYGGHMIIETIVAKKKIIVAEHALWIQGMLFGIASIFLPIFIYPNFLIFRNSNDFEDEAKTALSGVLWVLFWQIFSFIFFILSSTGVIFTGIVMSLILGTFMRLFSIYLIFCLFPFFFTNGFYIARWNSRLNWSLLGFSLLLLLSQIICQLVLI